MAEQAGASADERFAAAHRALAGDSSVQFQLPPYEPPAPPPAWAKSFNESLSSIFAPVGRFLRWIGSFMPDAPYARILLWAVLAIGAAGLLWGLWQWSRGRTFTWRRAKPVAGEPAWMPEAAPARAWLREADALAAEGRFAEAVHHLLLRSVEDIGTRRPQLVRPATTSRDLAGAVAIPTGARALFADLAALVERSLFGGRPVDRDDWSASRARYERFVGGEAWSG